MRFQLVLIFTGFTSSTKIEVRLPNFGGQIIKFLVASQICWTSSVYAMNVDNKCKAMYFGAGCFWHVQHELVDTEKKFLSRDDQHITVTVCGQFTL